MKKTTRKVRQTTSTKEPKPGAPVMPPQTPAKNRREIYEEAYDKRTALSVALDILTRDFGDWQQDDPVLTTDKPHNPQQWWDGQDYVQAIGCVLRLLEDADCDLSTARANLKGRG